MKQTLLHRRIDPFVRTTEAVATLRREVPSGVAKNTLVEVARRWEDKNLPDVEILEALAEVFRVFLAMLIHLHRYLVDGESRDLVPLVCIVRTPAHMTPPYPAQHITVSLESLEFVEFEEVELGPDEERDRIAFERYGSLAAGVPRVTNKHCPDECVALLLASAKRAMEVDGYHNPMVFYHHASRGWMAGMEQLDYEDRAQKYHAWHRVAKTAAFNRFDGLAFVLDAWVRDPVRLKDLDPESELDIDALTIRGEELIVGYEMSDGRGKVFHLPYSRNDDTDGASEPGLDTEPGKVYGPHAPCYSLYAPLPRSNLTGDQYHSFIHSFCLPLQGPIHHPGD